MNTSRPATSRCDVTAPTEDERHYDLDVDLKLRVHDRYRVKPWLRITANCATEEVTMAAGLRIERNNHSEDDGA